MLLLTHPTPDLDAIGFVCSARKVWGAGTPVACRAPTEAKLLDPTVVVGDIGWRRGTPPEQRWDGHDDRIGSPPPAGSRLKGDEVLAITVATL